MEAFGVEQEIRSTLNRRVDLPSGGYLVFDYAEAFTVIDVNTGRFVGARGKSSAARLEDTITKNNLEAVKEVVRQLRLRDIGGIIVIDFIDMANPKNRATVEEALQQRARARPDEDLRRRDLAARPRRDDAAERDGGPARDHDDEVPDLRRRRHRRLGGDGGSRRRAAPARARRRVARAGVPRRASRRRSPAILIGPGGVAARRARGRRRSGASSSRRRTDIHPTISSSSREGKLAELEPQAAGRRRAPSCELELGEVDLPRRREPQSARLDGIRRRRRRGSESSSARRCKVRIERVLDGGRLRDAGRGRGREAPSSRSRRRRGRGDEKSDAQGAGRAAAEDERPAKAEPEAEQTLAVAETGGAGATDAGRGRDRRRPEAVAQQPADGEPRRRDGQEADPAWLARRSRAEEEAGRRLAPTPTSASRRGRAEQPTREASPASARSRGGREPPTRRAAQREPTPRAPASGHGEPRSPRLAEEADAPRPRGGREPAARRRADDVGDARPDGGRAGERRRAAARAGAARAATSAAQDGAAGLRPPMSGVERRRSSGSRP